MQTHAKARERLRRSPGVALGVVALVVAMAGGAVALPGKGSVKQNDIAKDAVTSKAIKNGGVRKKDLAANAVPVMAYGVVTKSGADVELLPGSKGVAGVSNSGAGLICFDLDFDPRSVTANAISGSVLDPGTTVEVNLGVSPTCEAQTITKQQGTGLTDKDVSFHFIR